MTMTVNKPSGAAFVFSKIQLKLSTKQKLKIDVAGSANNCQKIKEKRKKKKNDIKTEC